MVDGDTGNAGLVILHLLQSEEAITLTFLSRCFEFIGQSLQWFVIHNLTEPPRESWRLNFLRKR
ncbi:hypothetical protein EC150317_03919 [Escherichia coli O145:H28]|nr:hypothetical protein EC150317_03919 [Escherichia coli O145:H28]